MEENQVPETVVEQVSVEEVSSKSGWDSLKPIEEYVPIEQKEESVNNAQPTQDAAIEQKTEPSFNENEWFKTKSGGKYEKWEDVEALLNKQTEVEKPSFANETSQKIYEAILNGKEDELADYFSKKQFVKNLATQPTEDVVKAYIQSQIPSLTQQEVERYYEKNYGVDEDNYSDEIDLSIAKKEAESKLERVKSDALNYFNSQSEKVQLPTFEQQQAAVNGFDAENPINQSVIQFVSNKAKAISDEIPFEYVNSQNGANIQGKIPLDTKAISEYESAVNGNVAAVIAAKYFKNDDFDSKAFARDQYILDNISEILKGSAAKSYNEGVLSKIAKDKNIRVDEQPNRTGASPNTSQNLEMAREYKFRGFPLDFIESKFGVSADQL